MTTNGDDAGRQIVSCDDCGTPYAAVESDGDFVLVGDGGACPNCESRSFSTISL